MENGKQPINPCVIEGKQGFGNQPTISDKTVYGLTKREYFAGLAMQGLLANHAFQIDRETSVKVSEQYVLSALIYADELLKQLEK